MLLALGVSYKTAPIEIREKLAFAQGLIPVALKGFVQDLDVQEVALLSTCNRTEFYCSTPSFMAPIVKDMVNWWQNYHNISFDMEPYLYSYADEMAISHMMRVASGIESMVIGESQILGQLKVAFQIAKENRSLGKCLSRLFQTSFSVAKKVRHTTQIASHPVSVAYAAVTLAKRIFSDLSKAQVLLIGSGENIELTIQHLKEKGVEKIIVLNRTLSRAKQLTRRYGGQALPLEALEAALANVDIVISACASQEPILTQQHIKYAMQNCKRRPIFMVDLGVPRNIEPSIATHEDIYLYTVDDLQGIVSENLKNRQKAALEAEGVIKQATQAYMHWIQTGLKLRTVRALRNQAEKLKNETLEQALKRLQKGDNPSEVLTHFAHQLTQKLLHQPTMGLKALPLEKIELIKTLFSIE